MNHHLQLARFRCGRPWLTNILLCLLGLGLLLLTHQFNVEQGHFVIGFSGVSGWSATLFVTSVVIILTQPTDRLTLWLVLGWAVAFRADVLFHAPYLSTDIYRYVWDGIVQHAGINPYRYVPADPALTALQNAHQHIFDNINRADYARTIYPPAAQIIYFFATLFSPTILAMKLAMFIFECITAAALIAILRRLGRSAAEVLLYAWCPLVVWEFGSSGHIDAAICAFISLALLFRFREQPALTGLFLGLAVMTKFYPLVLFPALWKRNDWKMPAVVVAVCAFGYALYLSAGKYVFGFLGGYAKEEGIDSGTRYFLLDWLHRRAGFPNFPQSAYVAFCALVFAAIIFWCWKHCTIATATISNPGPWTLDPVLRGSMALSFALMLLFSPHYPWYIAWLIPLFALTPNLPVLAYICAFFYGFTTRFAAPGPLMFILNKWLYTTVLLAFVVSWIMRRWNLWPRFNCRCQVPHP